MHNEVCSRLGSQGLYARMTLKLIFEQYMRTLTVLTTSEKTASQEHIGFVWSTLKFALFID